MDCSAVACGWARARACAIGGDRRLQHNNKQQASEIFFQNFEKPVKRSLSLTFPRPPLESHMSFVRAEHESGLSSGRIEPSCTGRQLAVHAVEASRVSSIHEAPMMLETARTSYMYRSWCLTHMSVPRAVIICRSCTWRHANFARVFGRIPAFQNGVSEV